MDVLGGYEVSGFRLVFVLWNVEMAKLRNVSY